MSKDQDSKEESAPQSGEQEPKRESKRATKPKLVPVKVIDAKGRSSLVEFERDEIPYRSYVDTLDLQDNACPEERLADAPHGIAWDFDLEGLEAELERALKQGGIWTYEDLAEQHRKLIHISTNLLGQRVWDAAKRWRKRSN